MWKSTIEKIFIKVAVTEIVSSQARNLKHSLTWVTSFCSLFSALFHSASIQVCAVQQRRVKELVFLRRGNPQTVSHLAWYPMVRWRIIASVSYKSLTQIICSLKSRQGRRTPKCKELKSQTSLYRPEICYFECNFSVKKESTLLSQNSKIRGGRKKSFKK